jgi:hypothetical protein
MHRNRGIGRSPSRGIRVRLLLKFRFLPTVPLRAEEEHVVARTDRTVRIETAILLSVAMPETGSTTTTSFDDVAYLRGRQRSGSRTLGWVMMDPIERTGWSGRSSIGDESGGLA